MSTLPASSPTLTAATLPSLEELGRQQVYPGHPLCIAVAIMLRFDSLAQATRRGDAADDLPATALRSPDIRGAGGNVYAALDLLTRAKQGYLELALERAEYYWQSSAGAFGQERVQAGQQQAQALRAAFEELLQSWPQTTTA